MDIPKPFLKWVGGKSQIIDQIIPLIPQHIRDYHEPFVGGGSVLLTLLALIKAGKVEVTGHIRVSDINPVLIAVYQNIQSKPAEVIKCLRHIIDSGPRGSTAQAQAPDRAPATYEAALASPESYYYWIRSRFNGLVRREKVMPLASAMFIYLNKTGFRGLYREGPNGLNVPYGHYSNPSIFDADHIYAVSALIQGVTFVCQPFEAALAPVEGGDFVYLDPPYAPETATSFVTYTAGGFDGHEALFNISKCIIGKGATFVMSNADVPLVQAAFNGIAGVTIKKIVCRRAINSKSPDSVANEVLVCGGGGGGSPDTN